MFWKVSSERLKCMTANMDFGYCHNNQLAWNLLLTWQEVLWIIDNSERKGLPLPFSAPTGFLLVEDTGQKVVVGSKLISKWSNGNGFLKTLYSIVSPVWIFFFLRSYYLFNWGRMASIVSNITFLLTLREPAAYLCGIPVLAVESLKQLQLVRWLFS